MHDIKIYSEDDFPVYLPKLSELYDDLFSGGKGFRSQMVCTVSTNIGLNHKSAQLLCQTIEFIHNASLLHDDLIDRAPLRRSKTSAWLKYSPEYAVLAGDYLLARVMVNLSRYGNLKLIQYTSEVISDLLEGEWLQDSIISDSSVRLEKLDKVHYLKTASLFEWCIRSPFIALEQNDPEIHRVLSSIGQSLGILFQRSDDLLDFDIRNSEDKKILGDLTGGYLNSFGAFLVQDLDVVIQKKLFQCRDMNELKKLVGEDYFVSKVDLFDKENSLLISAYKSSLNRLEELLPEDQAALTKDFEPLADLLYWRNSQ